MIMILRKSFTGSKATSKTRKVRPTAKNLTGSRGYLKPYPLDLARLRVAQIHGCKATARELVRNLGTYGVNPQLLPLLKDWRTQTIFSDREKAVLNLAEAVTLNGVMEASKNAIRIAKVIFGQRGTLRLILAILAENDWFYLKRSSSVRRNGHV
jgi:hypothetical protein